MSQFKIYCIDYLRNNDTNQLHKLYVLFFHRIVALNTGINEIINCMFQVGALFQFDAPTAMILIIELAFPDGVPYLLLIKVDILNIFWI